MQTISVVPVFHVSDVDAAVRYYVDVLGFEQEFRFDDYVGLKLGAASVHIAPSGVFHRPVGGSTAYIVCDEVDEYCAAIKAKGAQVLSGPADQPYMLRDFVSCDADGNHLSFGCALAKPA